MFFLRWVFLQSIRLNRTQGNQNESILQFILIGLPYARTWGAQQFKCLEAYKNTDLERKSWGVQKKKKKKKELLCFTATYNEMSIVWHSTPVHSRMSQHYGNTPPLFTWVFVSRQFIFPALTLLCTAGNIHRCKPIATKQLPVQVSPTTTSTDEVTKQKFVLNGWPPINFVKR